MSLIPAASFIIPTFHYSIILRFIVHRSSFQHSIIQKNYLPLALVTQRDSMIVSFGSKNTEKIWEGERIKRFSLEIQLIARRKLRMLNNSQNINDLTVPPSNHLEKLKGKLKNFYSIRINDQWRIIFIWQNNNAHKVEIIDYHK